MPFHLPKDPCAKSAVTAASAALRWFAANGGRPLVIGALTLMSDQAHTSINWQTRIVNGKSREDVTRRPYLRLKGWYTGAGYCESAYRCDLTPLPDAPVSGIWSPSLRMAWDGDSTDRAVTHSAVRLDPDFHADPPKEGRVLHNASGEFVGVQPIDTAHSPSR